MYFGCECGDGWYQLIYDLCKEITTYVNNLPETKGLDSIEVLQIKEKYGTLRFYISHGDTCIHKQIQTAEEKSAHICELCGEVGRLTRRGGYFQTLCTKCRMKKKAVLA